MFGYTWSGFLGLDFWVASVRLLSIGLGLLVNVSLVRVQVGLLNGCYLVRFDRAVSKVWIV